MSDSKSIADVSYWTNNQRVVNAFDYDALLAHVDALEARVAQLEAESAAVTQDCNILCNALQRIEAGDKDPRMIARRTLEHWSEKSALASTDAGEK